MFFPMKHKNFLMICDPTKKGYFKLHKQNMVKKDCISKDTYASIYDKCVKNAFYTRVNIISIIRPPEQQELRRPP